MPIQRAIILSDLHLGPNGPLAIFRDDKALSTFITDLAREGEPPTELVLAGDVFDFLQSPDYDGFDANRAEERFDAILRGTRTAPVLAALKTFAARGDEEITLLAGNHDPEMLLPGVRAMFEKAIGCTGRVRYGDDQPLWPGEDSRWPIWGRALGDEHGCVWVVHGDRWDPCNAIHRGELRRLVAEGRPVDLPVGSKLVYRVLNKLQPESRWIPYLKPDPVVLPLLLYLDPRVTLPFIEEHWGVAEGVLGQYVRGWLKLGALFGEEDQGQSPKPDDVAAFLTAMIAGAIREERPEPAERDLLLAAIQAHLQHGQIPAEGMLAAHGGVGRALLRATLSAARYAEQRRDKNGPDGILDAAERWLPRNVVALIAGHTHGPRTQHAPRPAYFNTGTWIPVGKVHEGEMSAVLDEIEAGHFQAEAPRTFARVIWGDGPVRVSFGRCDADGRVVEEG